MVQHTGRAWHCDAMHLVLGLCVLGPTIVTQEPQSITGCCWLEPACVQLVHLIESMGQGFLHLQYLGRPSLQVLTA